MVGRRVEAEVGRSVVSKSKSVLVNLCIVVMNYFAVCLMAISAILIIVALFRDGSSIGTTLMSEISRGDIIPLASQH